MALVSVFTGASEIAYTPPLLPQSVGASISSTFVTRSLLALLILTAPLAHAQSAQAAAPGMAAAVVTGIGVWEGKVSYLASAFTGRKTASGERFNPHALTMAHKTLAFGTLVRVTNPRNGKSVQVRVNDRGPFVADRVADLSHAAARQLDVLRQGVAHVQLEILNGHD